jgi:hypothetical protein
VTYTPFPPCRCPNCQQPLPEPAPLTQAEALVLNRAYEDSRRRYRAENPNLTKDDIAGELL